MNEINFAIQVMVLGFSVVIVTLVGLYFLLLVFARIFYEKGSPKSTLPEKESEVTSKAEPTKPDQESRKTAAIFAAVYRYLQLNNEIREGSRISIAVQPAGSSSTTGGWHITGRKALMENRMELERIRRMKQRENIQGNS